MRHGNPVAPSAPTQAISAAAGVARKRRGRGFTIVELLAVVALLAVYLIISAQLFTRNMRISRQVTQSQQTILKFDALVELLRRDVWNAQSIKVADPAHVLLVQAPDRAITWAAESAGTVRRVTEQAGEQRNYAGVPTMTFVVAGPVLRVQVSEGGNGGGQKQEIMLISQVMLAGGQR